MPGLLPSDDLDDDGVGADGDAESSKGGEDDGYDSLQPHISVKEVSEEHDEEELERGVNPEVSPGNHLGGGEGGEEAKDASEGQGDGESSGAMVAHQQLLQEAEVREHADDDKDGSGAMLPNSSESTSFCWPYYCCFFCCLCCRDRNRNGSRG